jgi:hypothetical protein
MKPVAVYPDEQAAVGRRSRATGTRRSGCIANGQCQIGDPRPIGPNAIHRQLLPCYQDTRNRIILVRRLKPMMEAHVE